MDSLELQRHFDHVGPTLGSEQPVSRRERVETSRQPLGELGLVGAAEDETLVVVCGD